MSTFVINGKTYTLVKMDEIGEFLLDELEILEEKGGLDLNNLEDVPVTVKLVKSLVYVSMLRSDPDADFKDAGRVKMSVLDELSETIANGDGVADPPTEEPEADGVPDSKNDSESSPGI